jgi:transposase
MIKIVCQYHGFVIIRPMKISTENKSINTSISNESLINVELNKTKKELAITKSELENAQNIIKVLEEKIKLLNQKKFGKSSESSKSMDLELVFDDVDLIETPNEAFHSEEETITVNSFKRKKTVGRKIDTSKLPREIITHDLSESEKTCACCQSDLNYIGDDISEKIELVPAVIKVIEHVTKKYACNTCKTAISAQKPESVIPKCMAGTSLLSEVVISKYQYHTPLYRQSKILLHAGIDIPDNTLGNWVMKLGDALQPLRDAFIELISKIRTLQADETPVKVLSDNKKSYMWAFHSCDPGERFILYEYDLTRAAFVPDRILGKFEGILQTDGYGGYNIQRVNTKIVSIGCFAHARRKFTDVIKVTATKTSGKAHKGLSFINKLYRIERKARDEKLSHPERHELRQKEATPILSEIKAWLDKSILTVAPKSAIGKAIAYSLNQWPYLEAYAHHGEVEIDNNLVENLIRPFALGRKNWLFVGNERGGAAAGIIYSLIQTCILNGVNTREYFNAILPLLPKVRKGEMTATSLLPQNFKALQESFVVAQ